MKLRWGEFDGSRTDLWTVERSSIPVAAPVTSRQGGGPQPRLEARHLVCVRGEHVLFSGLSFTLGPGELLRVAGGHGSGKSSLLRILCGIASPSDGMVIWRGRPVRETNADVSYLAPSCGLDGLLSAEENLRTTAHLFNLRKVDTESLLERVGLAGFEEFDCRHLSEGQRRRVALARLLVVPATLWILDEPFTALDGGGAYLVQRLIREHLNGGGMVVLTTEQPLPWKGHRTLRLGR